MYRLAIEASIRTSMTDFKKKDWLINLPLYAIDQIKAVTDMCHEQKR